MKKQREAPILGTFSISVFFRFSPHNRSISNFLQQSSHFSGFWTSFYIVQFISTEHMMNDSVTVGAPSFIAQIHSTDVNRGIPVLRTAEYPGAFASHSEEELRRNARENVWPQIVTALTKPVVQSVVDQYAAAGKRPYDEVIPVRLTRCKSFSG